MVTILLNGQPFPHAVLGNLSYAPVVLVDHEPRPAEQWILSTDSAELIRSTNPSIVFAPTSAEPHHLHVFVLDSHGLQQEGLITFNVVAQGSGVIEAGVAWSQPFFSVGDKLEGKVYIADPEGFAPLSLNWTLLRNGVPVSSGTGSDLRYSAAIDGVYTVKVSGRDIRNTVITGESTITVTNNYALQATPPPPAMTGSVVYLGALYSDLVRGPGGTAVTLPCPLASYTQDFHLPPGTTHVSFAIDGQVDDDVVVRSKIGNFSINGYPSGLYSQPLGYDYLPGAILPAPADLKTRLTFDAYNAQGSTYSAFSFRIKINCYSATNRVYRYERCPYSIHQGGHGRRQRKLAFLFTDIETQVDVDTTLNRYQTGSSVVSYHTPEVSSLPLEWMLSSGLPYPANPGTNIFFTEANRYAVYEADQAEELDAKAVCAVENIRPFYVSVQMPTHPALVQRIKRLSGKMVLYLADGGLMAGTVVTARVATGSGESVYTFNITEDAYNEENADFVRVGSVDIDLSDFQFGINGVLVRCEIDESGVVYAGTTPQTLPVWSEGTIFSGTLASAVSFDGACFSNPQLVTVLTEDAAAVVTPLSACHDAYCGPQGVYCYTAVCSPSSAIRVVQPLYNPAPFVALAASPYDCYGTPVFVGAGSIDGTNTVISNELVYANGSFCGVASVYAPCNGGNQIGVVYPCGASPHDFVKYGEDCYQVVDIGTVSGTDAPSLNITELANWFVEDGRWMDLLGTSPLGSLDDLLPGNGLYVDLLGSSNFFGQFGTLTSKQAWALTDPGDYTLSIDFAGNQRTEGATPFSVGVTVGDHGTAWFEDSQTQPFQRYDFTFTTTGSEFVNVKVFQNSASDWDGLYNAGNLLHRVHFFQVSPQTDLLLENFGFTPPPPLPDTVVSVSDVLPVADCQDIVCSGSNPAGDAFTYVITDSGSRVRVAFEGLDLGLPNFAVCPATIDTGVHGLTSGQAAFSARKPRQQIIDRVTGTGFLAFKVQPAGIDKALVRIRGRAETTFYLPAGRDSVVVPVLPGDAIWLDFGGKRVSVRIQDRPFVVTWTPRLDLLRKYTTAIIQQSGSVRALGFCGLTNRSDYVLFRSLPADSQTSTVVNPDCLVTVAGTDGVEYALVRNRASNEVPPSNPFPWYSGQTFSGSITFGFYAGRHFLGANGEMDVWLDSAGTVPPFFKISNFFGLDGSNSYRCDSIFGDISRNSVRVVSSLTGIGLPAQYYAPDGELRTLHTQVGTLTTDKLFTFKVADAGVSYQVSPV